MFILTCNLHSESHLSVCANTIEFTRHAFPSTTVMNMDAMGSPALSHNMTYVAAQAMFYLVAGARHIKSLGEMEAMHARCGSRISEFERHVVELGDDH